MMLEKTLTLILALLFALSPAQAIAADADAGDRLAIAQKERGRLFGGTCPLADTDPEFSEIRDKLLLGQIWQKSPMPEELRVLVVLASLAAQDNAMGIEAFTGAGLRLKIEPVKLKEAVYHVAPYIGYPRAGSAVMAMNRVFAEQGVKMPLAPQGTVTEENRFEKGLAVQKGIFGDGIDTMHRNAPAGQEDLVIEHLSAWCFGDTYTRGALDLKTRELLTLVAILSLGGCDSQVRSHVQGNLAVGNDKALLVNTLELLVPFNGYPRTLTALAIVNDVTK